MNKNIAVCGQGLLAEALITELEQSVNAVRLSADRLAEPGPWDGLIVATDCWDLSLHTTAHQSGQVSGIAWMPIHSELSTVVIGPHVPPGRVGCPECLRRRRCLNSPANAARHDVQAANAASLSACPSPLLTPLAAGLVATVASAELTATSPVGATRSAWFVRLDDLTVERHFFLPDPMCPLCGVLPDDAEDAARITLSSRPKQAPGRHRLWTLSEHSGEISRAFVGTEAGLIHEVVRSAECGLAVAEAEVTLPVPGVRVPGGGRSLDYTTSEAVAVLEALERFGGANPAGTRTVVRAAMADLQEPVLDPRLLGMHEDEMYEQMPHLYRPFTDETVCNWVWGYSLTKQRSVLVPESCAYFYTLNRPDPAFFAENTNGCALGSCLEEAIVSGILEVAERDALLLTWHSRLPARLIDVDATEDREPAMVATAIAHATGYRVSLFDITTEAGIPCVWAMATHPGLDDGALKPGSDQLALFCAAGSGLTPERAALSALIELGPQLIDANNRFPARRADAARCLACPGEVKTIFDHAVAFGDPRAFERMDFVTRRSTPARPLAAVGRWPENDDLRDDLCQMVDRYQTEGMELFVVNQTSPEHRSVGLHCVKVLIPGMVPLTYGHMRRRLRNLPRLLSSPCRLGYSLAPRSEAEINQLPHPFAA